MQDARFRDRTEAGRVCDLLRDEVDDVLCARTPEPFHAVGLWYHDFTQTSDEEVPHLLRRAAELRAA
jgi:putative phosphoribosyl transferase